MLQLSPCPEASSHIRTKNYLFDLGTCPVPSRMPDDGNERKYHIRKSLLYRKLDNWTYYLGAVEIIKTDRVSMLWEATG